MLPRALRLVTVRGIEVRVDPWLAPLALLLAWTFARRLAPGLGLVAAGLVGIAVTLGLLASVLVHELGHALEARHRGLVVDGITLMALGGATAIHERDQRPRDEFAVAAIGPWLSVTLAAAFGLVATAVGQAPLPAAVAVPVGAVAGILGWTNLSLAAFNLLPGAPLDGGRVLRAVVWRVTGDRGRAVRVSTRIGRLIGASLVGVGAWWVASDPAAIVSGAWTAVVGAFLWNGAGMERRHQDLRALLSATRVADLWDHRPSAVDADLPLDRLVPESLPPGTAHLPVVRGGAVVGALALDDLARLHPTDRALRRAVDLAVPLDDLPRVDRGADVATLLAALEGDRTLAVLTAPPTQGAGGSTGAGGGGEDGGADHVPVDVVDRRAVLAAIGAREGARRRAGRSGRGRRGGPR